MPRLMPLGGTSVPHQNQVSILSMKILFLKNAKFWFQLKPKIILKVFEFIQEVPHKVPLIDGCNNQKQYIPGNL